MPLSSDLPSGPLLVLVIIALRPHTSQSSTEQDKSLRIELPPEPPEGNSAACSGVLLDRLNTLVAPR